MIFGLKNFIFFSNLYAIYVEETLLSFSLLFYLKISLLSITTLTFWVAPESHLVLLLTAKSLSSMSPDSSSKKILDFVNRYLILIPPNVSNNLVKVKSNLNYKKQLELLFSLF